MTRSTSSLIRSTMSTIGPEMPGHSLKPPVGKPPSWMRTTIVSAPALLELGDERVRPCRPRRGSSRSRCRTARRSRACPRASCRRTRPSRRRRTCGSCTGGKIVLAASPCTVTFAARKLKFAPRKSVPSWQPSTGWQPPFCMRRSSVTPSSNSWLPTAFMSRPKRFAASIVGSSWKRPERSGLAPIRSPADTIAVLIGFVASSCFRCVAKYSAPPAFTVPMRPDEPDGGSRFPWKSLKASSCTLTVFGGFAFAAPAAPIGDRRAIRPTPAASATSPRRTRMVGRLIPFSFGGVALPGRPHARPVRGPESRRMVPRRRANAGGRRAVSVRCPGLPPLFKFGAEQVMSPGPVPTRGETRMTRKLGSRRGTLAALAVMALVLLVGGSVTGPAAATGNHGSAQVARRPP